MHGPKNKKMKMDGRLDGCLLARGPTLHTYRELFCELLHGFMCAWTSERPASIAEFERVQTLFLAQVRRRLTGLTEQIADLPLRSKPSTSEGGTTCKDD